MIPACFLIGDQFSISDVFCRPHCLLWSVLVLFGGWSKKAVMDEQRTEKITAEWKWINNFSWNSSLSATSSCCDLYRFVTEIFTMTWKQLPVTLICSSVWTCVAGLFDSGRMLRKYVNIWASPCFKNTKTFHVSSLCLKLSSVHLSQSCPLMTMMPSCRVMLSPWLRTMSGGDWPFLLTPKTHRASTGMCPLKLKPGRTELFKDGLKSCNALIKIKKVELSGEGIYRCFLPELQSHVFFSLSVN